MEAPCQGCGLPAVVAVEESGSRRWPDCRLQFCERCLKRSASLSWHYFRRKGEQRRAAAAGSAGASSAAPRAARGGSGAPVGA